MNHNDMILRQGIEISATLPKKDQKAFLSSLENLMIEGSNKTAEVFAQQFATMWNDVIAETGNNGPLVKIEDIVDIDSIKDQLIEVANFYVNATKNILSTNEISKYLDMLLNAQEEKTRSYYKNQSASNRYFHASDLLGDIAEVGAGKVAYTALPKKNDVNAQATEVMQAYTSLLNDLSEISPDDKKYNVTLLKTFEAYERLFKMGRTIQENPEGVSDTIKKSFSSKELSKSTSPFLKQYQTEMQQVFSSRANDLLKSVRLLEKSIEDIFTHIQSTISESGINTLGVKSESELKRAYKGILFGRGASKAGEVNESKRDAIQSAIDYKVGDSSLSKLKNAYQTSIVESAPWEEQYQYIVKFVKEYEGYRDNNGSKSTLNKYTDLYTQLQPMAQNAQNMLQNIINLTLNKPLVGVNGIEKEITNEKLKQKQIDEDEAEILAQENGSLDEKKERLRDISDEYVITKENGKVITQADRDKYEQLNQKDMDSGLTNAQADKMDELFTAITETDEALAAFEERYDRIIVKLENGKSISILPDAKGLKDLLAISDEGYGDSYKGIEISDIQFVRKLVSANKDTVPANRFVDEGLVAIHGISAQNLIKSLEQDAFASPSIAVTKPNVYAGGYGDATVVFKPNAIDPNINAANKIYGIDAYTPVYPDFGYELSEEGLLRASEQTKLSVDELRAACDKSYENVTEAFTKLGEAVGISDGFKRGFLDKNNISIASFRKDDDIQGQFHVDSEDFHNKVRDIIARDNIDFDAIVNNNEIQQEYFDAIDEYVNKFNEQFTGSWARLQIPLNQVADLKQRIQDAKFNTTLYQSEKDIFDHDRAVIRGENKVIDYGAMNDEIQRIINENRQEYNEYVQQLLTDIMIKPNVRGADGQRFDRTPEGIAAAMRSYGGKNALYSENPFMRMSVDNQAFIIAASKNYNNLDEVADDASRLRKDGTGGHTVLPGEYDIKSITATIAETNNLAIENVFEKILHSVDGNSTSEAIGKSLLEQGLIVDENIVGKIEKLVQMALEVPTRYFEAKPQGVLDSSSIDYVSIPKDSIYASNLKQLLQEKGIPFVEHDSEDDNSRIEALKRGQSRNFELSAGQNSNINNQPDAVKQSENGEPHTYDGQPSTNSVAINEEQLKGVLSSIEYNVRVVSDPDNPQQQSVMIDQVALQEALAKIVESIVKPENSRQDPSNNQGISNEIAELGNLKKVIDDVAEAVNNKTDAFKTEGQIVSDVIDAELQSLTQLDTKLGAIKSTLEELLNNINSGANNLDAGLSNIVVNVNGSVGTQQGAWALESTLQETNKILSRVVISPKDVGESTQPTSTNGHTTNGKNNNDKNTSRLLSLYEKLGKSIAQSQYNDSIGYPKRSLNNLQLDLLNSITVLEGSMDKSDVDTIYNNNQILDAYNKGFNREGNKQQDKSDILALKEKAKNIKALIDLYKEYGITIEKYLYAQHNSEPVDKLKNSLREISDKIAEIRDLYKNDGTFADNELLTKIGNSFEAGRRQQSSINNDADIIERQKEANRLQEEERKNVDKLTKSYVELGKIQQQIDYAKKNHQSTKYLKYQQTEIENEINEYRGKISQNTLSSFDQNERDTAQKRGSDEVAAQQSQKEANRLQEEIRDLYQQTGELQAILDNIALPDDKKKDIERKIQSNRIKIGIRKRTLSSYGVNPKYLEDTEDEAKRQKQQEITNNVSERETNLNNLETRLKAFGKFDDTISEEILRLQESLKSAISKDDFKNWDQQYNKLVKFSGDESYRPEQVKQLISLYEQLGKLQAEQAVSKEEAKKHIQDEIDALNQKIQQQETLLILTDEEKTMLEGKQKVSEESTTKEISVTNLEKQNKAIQQLVPLYEKLGKLEAAQSSDDKKASQNAVIEIQALKDKIDLKRQSLGLTQQELKVLEQQKLFEVKSKAKDNEAQIIENNKQIKNQDEESRVKLNQSKAKNRVNIASSEYSQAYDIMARLEDTGYIFSNAAKNEYNNKVQTLAKSLVELNTNPDWLTNSDNEKKLKKQIKEVSELNQKYQELLDTHEKLSGINALVLNNSKNNFTDKAKDLFSRKDNMSQLDFLDEYKNLTIEAITEKFGKLNVKVKDFDSDTQTLTATVKDGKKQFTDYKVAIDGANGSIVALRGTSKKAETFLQSIISKGKQLGSYLSAMGSYQKIWSALKNGVNYVKEIDAALTELKKVTNETDKAYSKFITNMSQSGRKLGTTVKDLILMTAEWARLGYSMKESAKLAESTAVLLNVSEYNDATTASQALISTMQAFQYTADQSMHVVDIMNEIGNNYAVSSSGIATALQDSASSLVAANNSYEEAVAMIAAAM